VDRFPKPLGTLRNSRFQQSGIMTDGHLGIKWQQIASFADTVNHVGVRPTSGLGVLKHLEPLAVR